MKAKYKDSIFTGNQAPTKTMSLNDYHTYNISRCLLASLRVDKH